MRKRVLWFWVLPLFAVILLATVNFRSGFILGEPDERVHAQIVDSLISTGRPDYNGQGFYFDLPAYFFVSSIFSRFLFKDPLVSLRVVSFVSALVTASIIGFYLSRKEDRKTGILGAILYFLIPLSIFYLRVGVIEPFLVLGMTGVICFFDLGRSQKNFSYSIMSGLFLGLALLTKYSILPIVLVIFLFFLIDILKSNPNFLKDRHIYVNLFSFVPLALGLAIFLPIFSFYYAADPANVKWQTLQILGFFGGVKQEFRPSRLLLFSWWFSWPLLALAVLGLGKTFRKYVCSSLSALLIVLVIIGRLPFYPRYALVLVPFLAIFSSLGLGLFKPRQLLLTVVVVLILFNFPRIYEAYTASHQIILEDSVGLARKYSERPDWVFSNYWPNYFALEYGVKNYSWLTYSPSDLRAFAQETVGDSLKLLNESGGVVFLENIYADLYLTQPEARLKAIGALKSLYKPSGTVTTGLSNFPFSPVFGNRVDIYIIKKP